jgi:hypothetical protein
MSSRAKAMLRACAVLVLAVLALAAWREIATWREQRDRTAWRLRAIRIYEQSQRGGGSIRTVPMSIPGG